MMNLREKNKRIEELEMKISDKEEENTKIQSLMTLD